MKKVLFISRNYKSKLVNGGNEVTKRNCEVLKEIYEVDEVLLEFKSTPLDKLKDILTFNAFNFSEEIKNRINNLVESSRYEFVWIDGSLYGSISRYLKKLDKDLKIVSFFHNVEYNYYKDKFKIEGLANIVMLPYSYINEKRIIKNSEKVVVLNNRDRIQLENMYQRTAEIILPLTLKDKFKEEYRDVKRNLTLKKALFVGSNFFANVHGITWFIDNVLDELDIVVSIVGQGMEFLKEKYAGNPKVEVLGFVDDIGLEYAKADFVITPIFHGSGMKTKTTEALMYGKTIYGTTEAFEGFELDFERVGGLCDSKEEFIKKISEEIKDEKEKINNYSRKVYEKKYSNEKCREILKCSI